ncbi:MAG: NifB/NifX family molybdenum-iron cluster-binding protein [Syntrophaceae bacterium]
MRIAIADWQDRISPVFDVSSELILIDIEQGREVGRTSVTLRGNDPFARAHEVADLGVQVLICGAISGPLETALLGGGIRVYGFVCGTLDEVLNAFMRGGIMRGRCRMPGCGGGPRRYRMRVGKGNRGRS